MSCICVGPKGSGKTHLLTALQNSTSIDNTRHSVPTVGTNIYSIRVPVRTNEKSNRRMSSATRLLQIIEIGGSMAPLWHQYFNNVNQLIYVVDTSNLCQISAAGVLFYSILVEPRLQRTKVLLVLAKMDLAYRQMRNEALLVLQIPKLKEQIPQNLTIIEASAISGQGLDDIYKWLSS